MEAAERVEAVKLPKIEWSRVFRPPGGVAYWESDCGRYLIWINGRPREEPPEWAASYLNQTPWLCSKAGSLREAKEVVDEHRRRCANGSDAT